MVYDKIQQALTRASSISGAPHNVLEHALRRLPELLRSAAKVQASGKDLTGIVVLLCVAVWCSVLQCVAMC